MKTNTNRNVETLRQIFNAIDPINDVGKVHDIRSVENKKKTENKVSNTTDNHGVKISLEAKIQSKVKEIESLGILNFLTLNKKQQCQIILELIELFKILGFNSFENIPKVELKETLLEYFPTVNFYQIYAFIYWLKQKRKYKRFGLLRFILSFDDFIKECLKDDTLLNSLYIEFDKYNTVINRRNNMKKTIKSGRFIKSGAGAGYDVTIEGIELDTQNIEILEQDSDSVHVKIPVKPCIADKWTAQSYYDGIDSDWGDGFFGGDDRRIDGGYVNMTIDIWENETAEDVIKNVPDYIDVKASYGWGWVHVNLPEEGMQFDYDHIKEPDIGAYGEIHLDEVDLICPEICADINAFFENPEGYYEGNEIDYNYDEDDEITNGLSFRDAVKDFKSAGKWNDYYEMQQDWEAYKDGLERDGVITEKSRSTWGNPCTPESFKRWNK